MFSIFKPVSKPTIHFVSLVGIDYDIDILPFWCEHYKAFSFDKYYLYLHSPLKKPGILDRTLSIIKSFGFDYEIVGNEIFGNGQLRSSVICEYIAKNCKSHDRVVTADSDELQDIEPDKYRALCCEYSVIKGGHLDRFDKTLHDAGPGIPLSLQYPLFGDVEHEVLCQGIDSATLQRWPKVRKDKILAARADLPVNYVGSHDLYSFKPGMKITSAPLHFNVEHYTWRNSILDRMAGKDYFKAQHIWYFAKFFKSEVTEAMQKLIDYSDNVERHLQGWKGSE